MVFHPVRYILKHSGVKEKPWLEINIYERHDSERHFPTELPASQEQTFTAKCSLWHLRQWWMITLAQSRKRRHSKSFFNANALVK